MLPLFFLSLGIIGLSVLIYALTIGHLYWGFWFWESIALSGMAMFPVSLLLEFNDEKEMRPLYLYFLTNGKGSHLKQGFRNNMRIILSLLPTIYILKLPILSKIGYAAFGELYPHP